MKLYIDPSTGSMLFAVFIGLLGALNWLVKGWIVKLRFFLSGGKSQTAEREYLPLVIFSDDKRYWSIFRPVCEELDRRGIEVSYLTASPDDPVLSCGLSHIHAEFIGEGNRAFTRLNLLKATILLATTPGLDVYQWKRSPNVRYYVHMLHAPGEILRYRMFGTDYYDAILLSSERQIRDIRSLEQLRNLPPKELVQAGIPYMDELERRLQAAPVPAHEKTTILLAPSWGSSAIFSRFGGKIIDALLETGHHLIIRPHPQSFTSETALMEQLMAAYPPSARLEWNRAPDNFDVLCRSDLLISDFSGVLFDFSLVYDKPVIITETEFDSSPYDVWWLDRPTWTQTALPRIGEKLTMDNLNQLPELIDACLSNPRYSDSRKALRQEAWSYPGEGARRSADYLEAKLRELTAEEPSKKGEVV